MKQFILAFLFISGLSIACGPQGVLYEYQNTQITFGSGGGFTGQVTEYNVDARGNLKRIDGLSGSETNLGKIKKADLRQIYKTLSEMNLSKMNMNQPGNMYYFIKEVDSSSIHEVIWGNPDYKTPDNIQEFYDLLISSMN